MAIRIYNNKVMIGSYTLQEGPGGLVFDGTNDHVAFASNPVVTNQITVEYWASLDLPTSGNYRIISGRENSYRMLYVDPNLYNINYLSWVCATVNNGWYTTGTEVAAVLPYSTFFGTHQIVGTYDGSRLRLYHDGALQATSSSNISGNILNNGTYWIGRTIVTGGSVDFYKGNLSIHRIYNRALSDTEILKNYNETKSRYGL